MEAVRPRREAQVSDEDEESIENESLSEEESSLEESSEQRDSDEDTKESPENGADIVSEEGGIEGGGTTVKEGVEVYEKATPLFKVIELDYDPVEYPALENSGGSEIRPKDVNEANETENSVEKTEDTTIEEEETLTASSLEANGIEGHQEVAEATSFVEVSIKEKEVVGSFSFMEEMADVKAKAENYRKGKSHERLYKLVETHRNYAFGLQQTEKKVLRLKDEVHTRMDSCWTGKEDKIRREGYCGCNNRVVCEASFLQAIYNPQEVDMLRSALIERRETFFNSFYILSYLTYASLVELEEFFNEYFENLPFASEIAERTRTIPPRTSFYKEKEMEQTAAELREMLSVLFLFLSDPKHNLDNSDVIIEDFDDEEFIQTLKISATLVSKFLLNIGTYADQLFMVSHLPTLPEAGKWALFIVDFPDFAHWNEKMTNQHFVAVLESLLDPSDVDIDSSISGLSVDVTRSLSQVSVARRPFVLSEMDFIELFERFPFDRYLAYLSSSAPSEYSMRLNSYVLQLLTTAIGRFKGYESFTFVLSSRCTKVILRTTRFISEEQDGSYLESYQQHVDEWLLQTARGFRQLSNRSIYSFLAKLPFKVLSPDCAWTIFYILYFNDNSMETCGIRTLSSWLELIGRSHWRKRFREQLKEYHTWVFLFETFAHLAESQSYELALAVTTELFYIGFIDFADILGEARQGEYFSLQEIVRECLRAVCMKHRIAFSYILSLTENEFKKLSKLDPQIAPLLFSRIEYSRVALEASDAEILRKWFSHSLGSDKYSTAMIMLSSMLEELPNMREDKSRGTLAMNIAIIVGSSLQSHAKKLRRHPITYKNDMKEVIANAWRILQEVKSYLLDMPPIDFNDPTIADLVSVFSKPHGQSCEIAFAVANISTFRSDISVFASKIEAFFIIFQEKKAVAIEIFLDIISRMKLEPDFEEKEEVRQKLSAFLTSCSTMEGIFSSFVSLFQAQPSVRELIHQNEPYRLILDRIKNKSLGDAEINLLIGAMLRVPGLMTRPDAQQLLENTLLHVFLEKGEVLPYLLDDKFSLELLSQGPQLRPKMCRQLLAKAPMIVLACMIQALIKTEDILKQVVEDRRIAYMEKSGSSDDVGETQNGVESEEANEEESDPASSSYLETISDYFRNLIVTSLECQPFNPVSLALSLMIYYSFSMNIDAGEGVESIQSLFPTIFGEKAKRELGNMYEMYANSVSNDASVHPLREYFTLLSQWLAGIIDIHKLSTSFSFEVKLLGDEESNSSGDANSLASLNDLIFKGNTNVIWRIFLVESKESYMTQPIVSTRAGETGSVPVYQKDDSTDFGDKERGDKGIGNMDGMSASDKSRSASSVGEVDDRNSGPITKLEKPVRDMLPERYEAVKKLLETAMNQMDFVREDVMMRYNELNRLDSDLLELVPQSHRNEPKQQIIEKRCVQKSRCAHPHVFTLTYREKYVTKSIMNEITINKDRSDGAIEFRNPTNQGWIAISRLNFRALGAVEVLSQFVGPEKGADLSFMLISHLSSDIALFSPEQHAIIQFLSPLGPKFLLGNEYVTEKLLEQILIHTSPTQMEFLCSFFDPTIRSLKSKYLDMYDLAISNYKNSGMKMPQFVHLFKAFNLRKWVTMYDIPVEDCLRLMEVISSTMVDIFFNATENLKYVYNLKGVRDGPQSADGPSHTPPELPSVESMLDDEIFAHLTDSFFAVANSKLETLVGKLLEVILQNSTIGRLPPAIWMKLVELDLSRMNTGHLTDMLNYFAVAFMGIRSQECTPKNRTLYGFLSYIVKPFIIFVKQFTVTVVENTRGDKGDSYGEVNSAGLWQALLRFIEPWTVSFVYQNATVVIPPFAKTSPRKLSGSVKRHSEGREREDTIAEFLLSYFHEIVVLIDELEHGTLLKYMEYYFSVITRNAPDHVFQVFHRCMMRIPWNTRQLTGNSLQLMHDVVELNFNRPSFHLVRGILCRSDFGKMKNGRNANSNDYSLLLSLSVMLLLRTPLPLSEGFSKFVIEELPLLCWENMRGEDYEEIVDNADLFALSSRIALAAQKLKSASSLHALLSPLDVESSSSFIFGSAQSTPENPTVDNNTDRVMLCLWTLGRAIGPPSGSNQGLLTKLSAFTNLLYGFLLENFPTKPVSEASELFPRVDMSEEMMQELIAKERTPQTRLTPSAQRFKPRFYYRKDVSGGVSQHSVAPTSSQPTMRDPVKFGSARNLRGGPNTTPINVANSQGFGVERSVSPDNTILLTEATYKKGLGYVLDLLNLIKKVEGGDARILGEIFSHMLSLMKVSRPSKLLDILVASYVGFFKSNVLYYEIYISRVCKCILYPEVISVLLKATLINYFEEIGDWNEIEGRMQFAIEEIHLYRPFALNSNWIALCVLALRRLRDGIKIGDSFVLANLGTDIISWLNAVKSIGQSSIHETITLVLVCMESCVGCEPTAERQLRMIVNFLKNYTQRTVFGTQKYIYNEAFRYFALFTAVFLGHFTLEKGSQSSAPFSDSLVSILKKNGLTGEKFTDITEEIVKLVVERCESVSDFPEPFSYICGKLYPEKRYMVSLLNILVEIRQ